MKTTHLYIKFSKIIVSNLDHLPYQFIKTK